VALIHNIRLTVNGRPYDVTVRSTDSLLDVLRMQLNITGPKRGCDEGECGCCTVLLDGRAVVACLVWAPLCDGKEVLTVEGLGSPENPHPLQRAFHEHLGTQCGFCTPGMVMAAKALLDQNPTPTREEVVEALAGNLCRCTGYYKIIEAVLAAAYGDGDPRVDSGSRSVFPGLNRYQW
jgi:carbon-monoxide dehydrogenase small subunit